jgi:hypothetical protein
MIRGALLAILLAVASPANAGCFLGLFCDHHHYHHHHHARPAVHRHLHAARPRPRVIVKEKIIVRESPRPASQVPLIPPVK